jgi:16S rRNA (cytosine1402-N4)-methyltransferase
MREVLKYLELSPGLTIADGTVGAGGHSREILSRIGAEGLLIGLDRDQAMCERAGEVLKDSNCHLVQTSYSSLLEVIEGLGVQQVDRVLLDLGLSSDQLADKEGNPAWKLIDEADEAELTTIFAQYGEERFSKSIARTICELKVHRPVRTADDLVEAVRRAVPRNFQRNAKKHSATRVFQALRIAVNEELAHLSTALETVIPKALKSGGRAVIISFHSLEDRIVKDAFRNRERWQNLTRKPVVASGAEVRINPRSRTAKLRAATRI